MERAWKPKRFSFEGEHYTVPEARVTPKPVQEQVPISWGLPGPKSLARAARRGGVLFPSRRPAAAEIREHLEIWRANEGGVDELPIIFEVFVAETKENAEELAAPAVTYLFRELYRRKPAEGDRELRDDAGNVVRVEEHVDFDHFKDRYIIGDPEFTHDELVRCKRELGITEIVCWLHLPGLPGNIATRSVKLFADEVMPAFRGGAVV